MGRPPKYVNDVHASEPYQTTNGLQRDLSCVHCGCVWTITDSLFKTHAGNQRLNHLRVCAQYTAFRTDSLPDERVHRTKVAPATLESTPVSNEYTALKQQLQELQDNARVAKMPRLDQQQLAEARERINENGEDCRVRSAGLQQ
eukprot:6053109-Prymnesium_polylepis.4